MEGAVWAAVGLPGLGGRGIAVGGGGLVGLVALVVVIVLQLGGGGSSPLGLGAGQSDEELSASCQTGADADQTEDCRIVAVVNSVQAYWGDVEGYQQADTVLFTGQVSTAAVRRARLSGRSTARRTSRRTSTCRSTTTWSAVSAPRAGRSPRPT